MPTTLPCSIQAGVLCAVTVHGEEPCGRPFMCAPWRTRFILWGQWEDEKARTMFLRGKSRQKTRPQGQSEVACESVQYTKSLHIIERDQSIFILQKNPHYQWRCYNTETIWGFRTSPVSTIISLNAPKSILRMNIFVMYFLVD